MKAESHSGSSSSNSSGEHVSEMEDVHKVRCIYDAARSSSYLEYVARIDNEARRIEEIMTTMIMPIIHCFREVHCSLSEVDLDSQQLSGEDTQKLKSIWPAEMPDILSKSVSEIFFFCGHR